MNAHPTRRDIVAGATALALSPARAETQATPASLAATATGSVTLVTPAGAPGKPVPGVLVSNGREIVRSGADGRFSIAAAPGQTIFMVKPSGFRPLVDPATNLPRISYVYDPDGTPESLGFRYRGLPPTGPLPASIDFTLVPAEEAKAFDVLLLTDPQPESTAELEYVRDDVIAALVGNKAAFGMTCGDLMFDDLSLYNRYNKIIGRIGIPWWNVGGNHDLDFEAPDAKRSRDTYKRVFGAPYYAHEYADALFVMLDNIDYLGIGTSKPGEQRGKYRGFFSADQLAFVKALLDATPADRLVVFVMHIPLQTYIDPTDPAQNTLNAPDLLKLIGDRPAVSFAGHTHSTEHHYLGAADGFPGAMPHHHHVLTAVSGSWWSGPLDHRGIACADAYDGTPNGHHVLSVDGTKYATRFVPAAEPADQQMRISLETQFHQAEPQVERAVSMSELLRSPITTDQAGGAQVTVNVFDGGPRTTVTMRLDAGPEIAMTRVARPDPFVVQLYGRYPETIKKWVHPQPCSHLWSAPLPPNLGAGTYVLAVHAHDEYGRAHVAAMVLEIV